MYICIYIYIYICILNCITEKCEVNYTIIEKYDNNVIVDKVNYTIIEKYDNNVIVDKVNYTIIEKYDNNVIVDKVIDGSDIFINGKIVDDFNILDKNYIYSLNVSATQQLNRIIMQQMKTNDLKNTISKIRGRRLARKRI